MPNPKAESNWEKEFYKEYFKGEFGWHYNADHTRQPEIEVDKLLPFISTQIEEAKKSEGEKIENDYILIKKGEPHDTSNYFKDQS